MTIGGISSQYGYLSINDQDNSKNQTKSIEEIAAEIIQNDDTDGDGALTVEEAGVSQETFDEADTNRDGIVTEEELRAAMEKKGATSLADLQETQTMETLAEILNQMESSESESIESMALNSYFQSMGLSAYEDQVNTYLLDALNGVDSNESAYGASAGEGVNLVA